MFNYLLPQMQREIEQEKVGVIFVPQRILSSVQTEILKRSRLLQVKTSFSDTGISPLLSIAIFPSKAKRRKAAKNKVGFVVKGAWCQILTVLLISLVSWTSYLEVFIPKIIKFMGLKYLVITTYCYLTMGVTVW